MDLPPVPFVNQKLGTGKRAPNRRKILSNARLSRGESHTAAGEEEANTYISSSEIPTLKHKA